MPADASIYGGIQTVKPYDQVNALARALQVQGLQQEQQMGRLKMDEYQRGVSEKNRLQELLSQGGDAAALRKGGFLKESMDMEKNSADVTHKKSETTKNTAEVASKKIGLYRDAVNGVNDPASAVAYIQAMHSDPDLKGSAITAVPLEQLIAQVPQDPAQFGEFKRRFVLGAEKYMADERQRQIIAETNRHNTTTEGETGRHNKSTEGIQQGQLRVSQGQLGVAQGNLGLRGQELDLHRTTAAQTLSKPFEVTADDGSRVLVQQDKQGNIQPVKGYSPKAGAGEKMTEDQGKATGWLIQAENAYKNMKGAMDPKAMFSPATPGVGDAIAAVPGLGGLGNALRSENRQKFVQGASSLSEALLRAATGAGVNKDEAKQKIQELTPQWGDGPDVIKQKTDAIPLYIESLKVRAGPGAKKAAGVIANAGVPSDIDAILKKHGGK